MEGAGRNNITREQLVGLTQLCLAGTMRALHQQGQLSQIHAYLNTTVEQMDQCMARQQHAMLNILGFIDQLMAVAGVVSALGCITCSLLALADRAHVTLLLVAQIMPCCWGVRTSHDVFKWNAGSSRAATRPSHPHFACGPCIIHARFRPYT